MTISSHQHGSYFFPFSAPLFSYGFRLQLIDTDRESYVWGSVIRALRENRVVFIQCDEIDKWKQSQNEKMLFLGKTIGVDKTINLIQKRTGAAVVFGVLHRFSVREYRLIIESYEYAIAVEQKTLLGR